MPIGFGTRLAGGCSSGHGIFGLSNLERASLEATAAFLEGEVRGHAVGCAARDPAGRETDAAELDGLAHVDDPHLSGVI